VVSGPATGEGRFSITMVRAVVGRGHQADIRVRDARMSRKHATIFFTGTEFRIRDEGSGNGTLLNGSRVVEYCVRNGDEVAMGTSVFLFHMEHVE
jgi:pSer/pThr/pTyr-binding forkhead associated (FHA) protein